MNQKKVPGLIVGEDTRFLKATATPLPQTPLALQASTARQLLVRSGKRRLDVRIKMLLGGLSKTSPTSSVMTAIVDATEPSIGRRVEEYH